MQKTPRLDFSDAVAGPFLLPIAYFMATGDYSVASKIMLVPLLTAGGLFSSYRVAQHVNRFLKRTP